MSRKISIKKYQGCYNCSFFERIGNSISGYGKCKKPLKEALFHIDIKYIENGTFSWGAEQKGILNADDEDRLIALNLRDINFTVKKGEFVCIIGEVGSGKSSLLNALLKNMIQVSPEEVTKILNARKIPAVSNVLQIVPEGKLTVALERDSAIPKNPMLEMAEKVEKKMENEIKENPD